ncbi:MAG: ABC transporter permease DevC [Prochlorotrichaceae cyanobacterium]
MTRKAQKRWWQFRTPLAWHNLTSEPRRLVTALSGVSFSVVLIFVFLGFKNGLYDSQVQLIKSLNGDIFILNRIKYTMFIPEQFARRRLYQAQAFDGVEDAYALYIELGNWKNPLTNRTRSLRVLAFNLNEPVLELPELQHYRSQLNQPWTALLDRRSRAEVGPQTPGLKTELSDLQVQLLGTFTLGTDFSAGDGNVIMSDQNFVRYFGDLGPEVDSRSLETIDIGLLQVQPEVDVDRLAQQIAQTLPNDVSVLTREQFITQELTYWRENTNIGFVFSLLSSLSFVVGVILVYQILYTDVADHWSEYATLKAIGYSNQRLLWIVMQEALILSVIGFIPGFLISSLLYDLIAGATGLVLQLTLQRILNIYIATIAMCVISGSLAMRKVLTTDPAEVFGL